MTTKEMIAVMQASEEGKTIQFRKCHLISTDDTWGDTDNPGWDWQHFDYRVKPEPVEIEMWVSPQGKIRSMVQEGDAASDPGWTKKKFREIL